MKFGPDDEDSEDEDEEAAHINGDLKFTKVASQPLVRWRTGNVSLKLKSYLSNRVLGVFWLAEW